jgi:hypothetical protein
MKANNPQQGALKSGLMRNSTNLTPRILFKKMVIFEVTVYVES